jgi:hypothetical protein
MQEEGMVRRHDVSEPDCECDGFSCQKLFKNSPQSFQTQQIFPMWLSSSPSHTQSAWSSWTPFNYSQWPPCLATSLAPRWLPASLLNSTHTFANCPQKISTLQQARHQDGSLLPCLIALTPLPTVHRKSLPGPPASSPSSLVTLPFSN